MMSRLPVLFCYVLVLLYASVSGQTWGCGERDYKCQLDFHTKALKADPKNPENYYNIGIVFQRSGAHKEAVESFSMYILIPGLKPEFVADGYNNRGISQRALKKPDLAYADYTEAIKLYPNKPAYIVNRGNALMDMKKFDQALEDYQLSITLYPKYASAYAQRGVVYRDQSRFDDALKDLGSLLRSTLPMRSLITIAAQFT
jgi:tetratricopeptide (TPR) repeat protein